MSGAGAGQRGRGGYDAAEIIRGIGVSFTAAQLERLAASMGVSGEVSFGRGVGEAARDLVRHFERKGQLGTLVAKLREAKPLMEWPELPEGGEGAGAADPDARWMGAQGNPVVSVSNTSVSQDNPGVLSGSSGSAHIDPFLAKPAGLTVTAGDEAPKSGGAEGAASGSGEGSPGARRGLGAAPSSQGYTWPGMTGGDAEESAPSRGVDPRIFIVASALMLVAVVIAFIAGRAGAPSAAPAGEDAGTPGERGAEQAQAPSGPAAMVASDIRRALAGVARACEVPVRGDAEEDVLLRAYDQCGPRPALPVRPLSDPLPPNPDSPTAAKSAEPAAGARNAGAPRRDAPRQAELPVDRSSAAQCMRGCDTTQRTCNSQCGAEPTQGTQYAEYQACLGRCLRDASKCRLACK